MCPVWASDCIIHLLEIKFLAVCHHYENVVNYILTARIKVSGTGGFFGGAGNALSKVLYGTGPIKGAQQFHIDKVIEFLEMKIIGD